MKKLIVHISILLSVILLAGCQRETFSQETIQEVEGITEIIARSGESQGKTYMDENGSFLWEPRDEISVFYNGDAVKFTSIISRPSEWTVFQSQYKLIFGGTQGAGKDYLYGISPYSEDNAQIGDTLVLTVPALQNGCEYHSSLVGRSTNTEMAFYHVCGLMGFSLTQSGIQSVSIKSNAGEPIAGKVMVVFDQEGKPVVSKVIDGVNTVRVIAESLVEGLPTDTTIFVPVLPQMLSQGFTVTFQKAEEVAYKSSTKQSEIRRRTVAMLGEVDSQATFNSKYVDLGLSAKWSTFNLGADSPEESGRYYAFGDLNGQIWCGSTWMGDGFSYQFDYELDDNKLDSSSDAAYVNWGKNWRMPTKDEYQELIDNCEFTWTINYNGTGVAGMIVTSRVEGYTDKSIFFPASGLGSDNNLISDYSGRYGNYWSATDQIGIGFDDQGFYVDSYDIELGLPIRPVINDNRIIPVTPILGAYTATSSTSAAQNPWTMTIYEDANDSTKVWIDNIFADSRWAEEDTRVYGKVKSRKDTLYQLVVPLGQQVEHLYNDFYPMYLYGCQVDGTTIDSVIETGSVTATIGKDASGNITLDFGNETGFILWIGDLGYGGYAGQGITAIKND